MTLNSTISSIKVAWWKIPPQRRHRRPYPRQYRRQLPRRHSRRLYQCLTGNAFRRLWRAPRWLGDFTGNITLLPNSGVGVSGVRAVSVAINAPIKIDTTHGNVLSGSDFTAGSFVVGDGITGVLAWQTDPAGMMTVSGTIQASGTSTLPDRHSQCPTDPAVAIGASIDKGLLISGSPGIQRCPHQPRQFDQLFRADAPDRSRLSGNITDITFGPPSSTIRRNSFPI